MSHCALAQNKDTIIYDSQLEIYHIFYSVKLVYAKDQNGNLRKLDHKEEIKPNEEVIEKDTLIYLIFEPSTKIVPILHCFVKFNCDSDKEKFIYSYIVENNLTAKQSIDYFILGFGDGATIYNRTTNAWYNGPTYMPGALKLDSKLYWSGIGDNPDIRLVKPGEKLDGFNISSPSQPGIFKVLFQGIPDTLYNSLIFGYNDSPIRDQIYDLLYGENNFVKCMTIAPSNVTMVIGRLAFLDTLISYTSQSLELGWIKQNSTSDKYLSYFNSAKTQLEQDNINQVRDILKNVLKEVDKDSTEAITSEAYALIRYNTEYLLEQLPEVPVATVLELLDTLRARLKSCYDNQQLGEKKFYSELDSYIKDAIKKYQKQDTIGCSQEIERFYSVIHWEYQRKPKRNDKRYVSTEGYQQLYLLARHIESRVVTLPAGTKGTIIEQIAKLKEQVRVELGLGNIGGEVLVRGLEKLLDRSSRSIVRKDTVGARMHLELFRQTVREVYEYTLKHPNRRVYITPAGYISLYYRARYIVETLRGDDEEEGINELRGKVEQEEEEYRELLKEMKE